MAGGKFLGWILDGVPNLVNWIAKKKRIKDVKKIDDAVIRGDDKHIGDVLRKVVKSETDRRNANS